jgi:hypothetical protein
MPQNACMLLSHPGHPWTSPTSSPESAHGAITMIPSTYLRFALHAQPNTGHKGRLERGTRRAFEPWAFEPTCRGQYPRRNFTSSFIVHANAHRSKALITRSNRLKELLTWQKSAHRAIIMSRSYNPPKFCLTKSPQNLSAPVFP